MKPIYKEKIRLRSYGVPNKDTKVYLEVKKKYKGVVNKRRSTLRLKEAYEFTETREIPKLESYMNPQVLRELNTMTHSQRCSYPMKDRRFSEVMTAVLD